jgi:hypothetical protein
MPFAALIQCYSLPRPQQQRRRRKRLKHAKLQRKLLQPPSMLVLMVVTAVETHHYLRQHPPQRWWVADRGSWPRHRWSDTAPTARLVPLLQCGTWRAEEKLLRRAAPQGVIVAPQQQRRLHQARGKRMKGVWWCFHSWGPSAPLTKTGVVLVVACEALARCC